MQSLDVLDPQHFMTGEYLFNDVKAYSALGDHRTASEVDRKTSQWLAKQLEAFGFTSKLVSFRVRQFQFSSAKLSAHGPPIPCFPLWIPRPTSEPLRAPIARGRVKGCVAIARFPKGIAITPAHMAIIQPLIDAGAVGIIGVTPSGSGEMVALDGATSWPIPIVLVGPSEEMTLRGASDVAISIEGHEDARAEAFNVVGEIGMGKKRFVISTPSSGWFHCAGERGPGIALWLALARWASHRESNARYTFVASSGHELGINTQKPEDVDVGLQLGASIAAKGATRKVTTSRREWLPVLKHNFADAEFGQLDQDRSLTISGSHPLSHSAGDLPSTTSGALLEPVGQALLRTIVDLESDL